jgi:hypothetical protein
VELGFISSRPTLQGPAMENSMSPTITEFSMDLSSIRTLSLKTLSWIEQSLFFVCFLLCAQKGGKKKKKTLHFFLCASCCWNCEFVDGLCTTTTAV